MKLVRLGAAVVLTFAVACGGGADGDAEGASGADANGWVPSKETAGAELVLPGTNTSVPANENASPATGASGTGSEPGTGDPSSDPSAPSDPATADPGAAAPVTPAAPKYVPPECGADCVAGDVPGVIARASKKYNLPRWFYYAVIRRESTFDRCKTQPENAPNRDWGRGLTQVTFSSYAGVPYPQHISSVDNLQSEWRSNMGLNGALGPWIDMKDVTPILSAAASESDCRKNPKSDDAYDPKTNIDRFSTAFAAPAYHLFHVAGEDPAATLRKVAYHWHYGLWGSWQGAYPADPRPYLTCATCYDTHVNQYRAVVEAEDGVWSGPTCKAPYSDSGC
jgi:hypothetical protein